MKKNIIKKLHSRYVSYLHGLNQNVELDNIDEMDEYDILILNAM